MQKKWKIHGNNSQQKNTRQQLTADSAQIAKIMNAWKIHGNNSQQTVQHLFPSWEVQWVKGFNKLCALHSWVAHNLYLSFIHLFICFDIYSSIIHSSQLVHHVHHLFYCLMNNECRQVPRNYAHSPFFFELRQHSLLLCSWLGLFSHGQPCLPLKEGILLTSQICWTWRLG